MRPERPLGRQAVDGLGTGPALRGAQHDHRPARPLGAAARASSLLDRGDLVQRAVELRRQRLVHRLGVVALDEARRVPVALEQRAQLVVGDARQDGRVGDLVAVQVQHREDRPVAGGVDELVRVPARGQRPGLRLAVAHDAQREQVGVVEHRPVGVHERIAQLAALVDRPGRLRRDMRRDAAGVGELAEQPAQALGVRPDLRIDLAVGPLQVGVGDERRAAVPRPGDEHRGQVARADRAVHVRVQQVEARCRAPVAEQPGLDVVDGQRLAQQRVVAQVDLADRDVVGGAPVRVDQPQLVGAERAAHLALSWCAASSGAITPAYSSSECVPRNRSRTRSRAAAPIASAAAGSSSRRRTAAPKAARSSGSIDQDTPVAIGDLVGDPADAAGHDRPGLPHGLRDGQPEPLGQALLHHDRGVALERVDDRRVLLQVVHRQKSQVDALAHGRLELAPVAASGGQHGGALGIVGHGVDRRPCVDQVRVGMGGDVTREPVDHADGVLQRVPARHLQHVALARLQRPVLVDVRRARDHALAAVEAPERRRASVAAARADARRAQDRVDGPVAQVLVLGGERVDRRGDDPLPAVGDAVPRELGAGEDDGLRGVDVRGEELPRLARQVVRMVDADVAAPDDDRAVLAQPRAPGRRSAGRAG